MEGAASKATERMLMLANHMLGGSETAAVAPENAAGEAGCAFCSSSATLFLNPPASRSKKNTITVVDNRTGKTFEFPIKNGVVASSEFAKIVLNEEPLRYASVAPPLLSAAEGPRFAVCTTLLSSTLPPSHRGSPISTARRASCATAATRSSSWPSNPTFSRYNM